MTLRGAITAVPRWSAAHNQSRYWFALTLALVLSGTGFVGKSANAQDLSAFECQLGRRGLTAGSVLLCNVDATSVFDRDLEELLENGFTNDLVYRVYLFDSATEEAVSVAVVRFAEVFRLYTDVYYVSEEGADGYVETSSWTDAVGSMSRFVISFGVLSELGDGPWFTALILEINPISAEHIAEARRWIANSRGARLFGDRSFFGNFVSLFMDAEAATSEAVRVLRSPSFGLSIAVDDPNMPPLLIDLPDNPTQMPNETGLFPDSLEPEPGSAVEVPP